MVILLDVGNPRSLDFGLRYICFSLSSGRELAQKVCEEGSWVESCRIMLQFGSARVVGSTHIPGEQAGDRVDVVEL
jgi:hypothetical protein